MLRPGEIEENSTLGKEKFLKTEKETLEKYMMKFEEKEDEQDDALFSDVEPAESSHPEDEESDGGEADEQYKITVQRGNIAKGTTDPRVEFILQNID